MNFASYRAIVKRDTPIAIGKFSAKDLKGMSRKNLETLARAVFINRSKKTGLSQSEADYRARALMSGNSDAQLRKYIVKYSE